MGFLIFILFVAFIIFIVILIKSSKNKDFNDYYSSQNFYSEDLADDLEKDSSFPYPDPYDLPPESAIYLDEDGELLEDL